MKLGFGYFFCFTPIKILVFYLLFETGSPWPSTYDLSSDESHLRGGWDPGLMVLSFQVEWLKKKGLGEMNYLRRKGIYPKRLDLALEETWEWTGGNLVPGTGRWFVARAGDWVWDPFPSLLPSPASHVIPYCTFLTFSLVFPLLPNNFKMVLRES